MIGGEWIRRRMPLRVRGSLGDSGIAAVEMALATPVLLLLMTGSFDFGRALYQQNRLLGAARAGVQYAIQNSTTWTDSDNIITAVRADAGDATAKTLAVSSQLCHCPTGAPLCSSSASCSGSVTSGTYVQVSASLPYATLLHYPFVSSPITLSAKTMIRVE